MFVCTSVFDSLLMCQINVIGEVCVLLLIHTFSVLSLQLKKLR